MRDVNNGWILRYTHGAPCDGMFEQTDFVENIICLLSIIPLSLINLLGSEQSILLFSNSVGPVCRIIKGALHGKVNKLDTSNWAKYFLAILSRICRLLSVLPFPVHVMVRVLNETVGVHIWIKKIIDLYNWCKFLNKARFKQYKPREVTASVNNKRSRSLRSTSHLCGKEDRFHNLTGPKTFKHYLSTSGGISNGPDSPNPINNKLSERTSIPVFSWLREQLNTNKLTTKKYNNLIKILADKEFLIKCYLMIKSNPGNMSPGSTNETLDGISMDYFTKLSDNLLKGKFNFTPTRRIMIPKGAGKFGERPLSIANPREKIVQKALALVLERIFEPLFLENSHGFRPNKGVHSALKQLHIKGGHFTWVINGDISKCFDKIPHDKIMTLLGKKISCHRTLELIKKSLINPAIKNNTIIPSHIGTPQGSIVSPILSNIVLHELDVFISKLKLKFDKGSFRRVNPKYHSLGSARHKSKNAILRSEHLKKMMNIPAKDNQDPNFRRLMFIRYADDFIVLLICSITEAYTIRRKIRDFQKNHLGLDLNVDKTTINNIKDGFNFLGAHIKQRGYIISKVRNKKSNSLGNRKDSKIFRRRHVRRLSILAPLDNIISKLINLGFAKRNHLGNLLPKSRRDLVNLSHYEILSFYNSRIKGTFNFFSFAGNYDQLRKIWWIYAQSCAITLALKYKIKTMRAAFIKFGKNLKDPNTDLVLYQEKSMKVKHDYKTKPTYLNEKNSLDKILSGTNFQTMTQRFKEMNCALCSSSSKVEMHHIRSVKDVREKIRTGNATYSQWRGGFLRKQVPLCHYHHDLLHQGKLNSFDLRTLKQWSKKLD